MVCAIAMIDANSRARLAELAGLSERFGIPKRNVHGHITLATYIGNNEREFVLSCKASLSVHKKFYVRYDSIEIWSPPAFIVAVPRKENSIAVIQKKMCDSWSQDLNEWTQNDVWRPHTTLVTNPQADFPAILEAMQEKFEPFVAEVDRIEFSRVCENGYEIIDSVKLK